MKFFKLPSSLKEYQKTIDIDDEKIFDKENSSNFEATIELKDTLLTLPNVHFLDQCLQKLFTIQQGRLLL